jgi:hypothetical protein
VSTMNEVSSRNGSQDSTDAMGHLKPRLRETIRAAEELEWREEKVHAPALASMLKVSRNTVFNRIHTIRMIDPSLWLWDTRTGRRLPSAPPASANPVSSDPLDIELDAMRRMAKVVDALPVHMARRVLDHASSRLEDRQSTLTFEAEEV